jgi:hypothetical protein
MLSFIGTLTEYRNTEYTLYVRYICICNVCMYIYTQFIRMLLALLTLKTNESCTMCVQQYDTFFQRRKES